MCPRVPVRSAILNARSVINTIITDDNIVICRWCYRLLCDCSDRRCELIMISRSYSDSRLGAFSIMSMDVDVNGNLRRVGTQPEIDVCPIPRVNTYYMCMRVE